MTIGYGYYMKTSEVIVLARHELNLHELRNWKVVIVDSKSYAGRCCYRRWSLTPSASFGTIELSRDFMEVFGHAEALETIRHEIAHALNNPKNKAHGPEWKHMCRKVGSNGERTIPVTAPSPPSRYKGICAKGHEVGRHRLTQTAKTNMSCERCDKKYNPNHKYNWYDGLKLVHSNYYPLQKAS